MKFGGELKFPEIDHPGVPVSFVIEGTQAELIVEGESLGRWSLYDIHARRLVASAFQIDLDGTEVTFVADDPVDFAYRGVEHMAETWASIKSKRIAARTVAVRKSRSGTIPSRIDDLKAAMEANLDAEAEPRQIAGEMVMPDSPTLADVETTVPGVSDWDQRDGQGSIPLVGAEAEPPPVSVTPDQPGLTEEALGIEEEKRRIAEEWAKLEEERRRAEQQEANRIAAFRIEMQRLEAERAELRRQAEELTVSSQPEPEAQPVPESQPEPEAQPVPESQREPEAQPVPESQREPEAQPVPESVFRPEPEPEPPRTGMVDLNDLEVERAAPPPPTPAPAARVLSPSPDPEPAMAGAEAVKDRSGLMGVVRAAFKSGTKDHDHQFIEAPGGIGITRYVCEECGYVSISA